jgi:ribosomal protein S18 acetylase RimI-like enzyme
MPDMLVRLYDLPDVAPYIAKLNERKINIRTAMAYEKKIVVDWVTTNFNHYWASEFEVSFANHPVSCYIATEAGKILGFGCHESTNKCYFGPTGVAEARRKDGIGTAILLSCLKAMREMGYAYGIIGGVDEKSSGFYARVVGATLIPDSVPGIYRDML